jgi:hypothetical protein
VTKPLRRLLPLAALVALTAAACGNSTTASRAPQPSADSFVLTEWSVTVPTNPIHAGSFNVTASNQGHETHELVIVRAANAAALPTKPDGSVDEDKIPESDKVGEIAGVSAGKEVTKAFNLPAGNYVALCNIVDQMGAGNGGMGMNMGNGMSHVHYVLGMMTTFTVI